MTTQLSGQIRFVKCPRCRKILPEPPEVQMYQCGGCGTVLRAKARKPETNHAELPSQEIGSAEEGQLDNVSGQMEDRSSNADLTDAPKVELSTDEDNIRRQEECDGSVHNGGASDSLSGSPDITSPWSVSSPSEVQKSLENDPLGRSPQNHRSKSGEWTAGSNSSIELPSSGEISLEAEGYTPEASEHVEQYDQSHLHPDYSLKQTNDGESQRMWPAGEVQNLPKYEDQESGMPERIKDNNVVPEIEEMSRTFLTDQNGQGEIKHVRLDSPSGITSHENDITSPSAEVVDNGSKGLSVFKRSSIEKSMSPKARNSVYAPQSPSKGSLVSFYLTSDDERVDHSSREVAHKFERLSSIDTLGSPHHGDLSSELNFRHGSTPYYPTSRGYYAYDGSESSYDGIDDKVHEHVSHPSRKDKDVSHTRTREGLRKDGFSGNTMVNNETETTHRAMHRPWNRGKSTEANSRYSGRNRMRLDAQEDVSRLPLPSRDAAGRRPAGISGQSHNLLPPHPAFNLSDKSSYSDPEKFDLLRTVCYLKDQLERMQFSHLPYNPLAPEREMYGGVYDRRHDNGKGYGERYNGQRMAFSGEAAHFRHQASCSCLHCCPQDWHYSAQLPSHSLHRKNGHCFDRSNSLRPDAYATSEPSSWGGETKPDNQRADEIKRLQLREQYNTGKRHLRPIAGGAPVIACYHCSELLQLPVDFLLFKKKYHQLMCNACQKVLKFSFLKGTCLVPYVADAAAPPPSEADNDYHGDRINVEAASRLSSSCQHVESLSCSDDYGRSFCRSCSTEGEVASVALPPHDRVKREPYSRKTSSGSCNEPIKDRKLKGVLAEPREKNEGSPESVASVGPSLRTLNMRNVTSSVSEIEELPPSANSPLHRLMGYSTPSKVFRR